MSEHPIEIYHVPIKHPPLIESPGILIPLILLGIIFLGLTIWGFFFCCKCKKEKDGERMMELARLEMVKEKIKEGIEKASKQKQGLKYKKIS